MNRATRVMAREVVPVSDESTTLITTSPVLCADAGNAKAEISRTKRAARGVFIVVPSNFLLLPSAVKTVPGINERRE